MASGGFGVLFVFDQKGHFSAAKGVLCFFFFASLFSLVRGKKTQPLGVASWTFSGRVPTVSFRCFSSSLSWWWQRRYVTLFSHVGECPSALPDQSLDEKLQGWDDATNEPPSLGEMIFLHTLPAGNLVQKKKNLQRDLGCITSLGNYRWHMFHVWNIYHTLHQ